MKKVIRIMGLCALVALAATSCKKDEQKLTSSFKAELTQPTSNAKTHLGSDSCLYWNSGDAIKVFDANGTAYEMSTTDNNVKEATFTSETTLDANESYAAFYPAAGATLSGTEVLLGLPAVQTYVEGTFGNATYPMAATNTGTSFTFHSSCGLLAIPVKGTGNIGSIELTSKTAGENLTGQLRYDLDGNYLGFTGEGTTVTLDCGNIALDTTNATTFYFVLPKDVFANGFKAVLKNGTTEHYTLETALPNTIAADTIKLMPEVTVSAVAVATDPIANVGYTDATVNGSYTVPTGMSVTEVGFYFGTDATSMTTKEQATLAASFSHTFDGLTEGTTYYYMAYAKNGTKEYTGATESFTTSITATAPSVTTDPTGYEPTATAGVVVCYGALESLDNITEYGICWSTESFSKATVTYVRSTNWNSGIFSASFEVTDGLTYYYRAYAINTANLTGYGEIQSFTPLSVPTVTTSEATAVTTTTATCGGSVTSYGGTTPTQYGICWSTSANPTISDSKLYTDGEPLDDFAFNMTGLTHSTTYHVRAYATNGVGTGYGSEVTFTTLPEVESFTVDFENGLPEGWTTIDADGDGHNWVLDTECESAYGYNQSNAGFNGGHMILSGSYHKTDGALHPDNYLVSPKVTLRSGSTFSFWAGAQDYQYPAEHFGVFVSDNGTSGWTMVQEWTMEAKGASGDKGFGRDGNTRDQGRWYYFSVDLSTYAGEKKYIAIRHFNCSDNFFLNVDNIRLGDPDPGTSFSQNFNNSVLPEGWTTIDADGDGYNWVLTNQMAAYGYSSPNDGHYGTVGMTSGSYHGSAGALTPDNYLVTPKVNLVQGSTFSFWACAQDADYPAEHFGVYVSDNGTSGWTMVQEWTMTAKGASGNKGNGRDGNTRDIGNWYQYTVDLSAYAGEKYIAIRHFNCSDEFFLEVDDILLTVNR